MADVTHRFIETNGIRMHLAEQGRGALVVLCHGFPESWYSWRHQFEPLAEAGFHAVAPDMRGYGQTDAPDAIDQYTLLHVVGDMVGLLDRLGEQQAVIAGHDWGALVAWHAALLRPDRFRAAVALSVPFLPRPPARPSSLMPRTDQAVFYQLYYQTPDTPEAELGEDVRTFLHGVMWRFSGDCPLAPSTTNVGMVPRAGGLRMLLAQARAVPLPLPAWLSQADLDYCVGEYVRSGLRGGLNWYRNIDRNWELLAAFAGAPIRVPALFVAGERDPVFAYPGVAEAAAGLAHRVPGLRQTLILPGCGHWVQHERPAETNAALLTFLRAL